MKGNKVLSLFDGMACGMLAFLKANIPVEKYIAYEIDKYAIQTAIHNFPEINQRGDVFFTDFSQYKDIDYLVGGSPCTYWSIAQKNNRETEASGMGWELFSQYVRALREVKPKFFIYENNKSMSKAIRQSITETFGFEPICINSALVSAQNRQRLYWVGVRNDNGTYSKVNVEQPADKGILLKDIIDSATAFQDKSYAYTTRCQGAIPEDTLSKHRHTMVSEPVNITNDEKSQCLRATYYKDGIRNLVGNSIDCKTCIAEPVEKPMQVGSLPRPNGELSKSQAFRIYNTNAKSVTINAGGGGAGDKTGLYAIPIEFFEDIPVKAISGTDGKAYTVYEVKNGSINIKNKEYPIKLTDGFYIIRKLTVSECKRLQTVPEWYEFPVSNSQAYKLLGNGWTVDVIVHILNEIKRNNMIG